MGTCFDGLVELYLTNICTTIAIASGADTTETVHAESPARSNYLEPAAEGEGGADLGFALVPDH
jgi:hypothetical protein